MPASNRPVDLPKNSVDQPNLIHAIGPDGAVVRLAVDPDVLRRVEDDKLNGKIGEFCGLIHGNVPNGTRGLASAHALYRGLMRPRIEAGRDEEVFNYVCDPPHNYCYPSRNKFDGDGPIVTAKPVDSVFVVHVEFLKSRSAEGVDGRIIFWEWVLAEAGAVPVGAKARYSLKVW